MKYTIEAMYKIVKTEKLIEEGRRGQTRVYQYLAFILKRFEGLVPSLKNVELSKNADTYLRVVRQFDLSIDPEQKKELLDNMGSLEKILRCEAMSIGVEE